MEEWELIVSMQRTGLRNKGGKKPVWKWNEKHGKLIRNSSKGGIDWWRYQQIIMIQKLMPFVQAYNADRALEGLNKMIVQEENAPSQAHKQQSKIYNLYKIQRLLWQAIYQISI